MIKIFSEKNKSIYQMTQQENEEDRMTVIRWISYGMCWGIGGFCTLWVIVAMIITVYYPPMPDVPIVVTLTDLMLESYEREDQQKLTDPPVTIPSKPDEQEWITVKRLVKK